MKASPRLVNGFRNRILSRLSIQELRKLEKELERFEPKLRDLIYEPNVPFKAVYFPETAVASIVTVLDDGTVTEVATVGYEGMIGLPVFLGGKTSPGKAFWQIAGSAFRIDEAVLRRETKQGGELAEILHLYIQAFFTQIAQSATCNRLHSLEKRCCRWLLMTHDRVDGDEFELTHEFLAQMLGVQRSGVTIAAGVLQKAGLIRYSRGLMKIIDRDGLEKAACECHRLVREDFERLLA
jgi:CRP-like cAMP-binding protein